jgi:membrane protease YdiL (CAAX protease family)
MFIEQGIKRDHNFGKYLLGSLLIFIASQIGSFPLLIGVIIKSFKDGLKIPSSNDEVIKFFEPNLSLFLLFLMFVFAIVGIYFVVKYLHKQTFKTIITSRKNIDWSRVFFSFALWSVITIGTTLITYYYGDGELQWNFNPGKFAILAVIAIALSPIQTSTEELVFRGYLMQGFGGLALNKLFPLVMTSVIFGGMHITNPEVAKLGYIVMIYYIGTGFFLGILTLMDEGMELALGFHAANNLLGALLVTSDWSVFQTYAIFKDVSTPTAGFETVFMPVFVLFPILLFIFSKKYNWTNWKEKLTGKIEPENNFNAPQDEYSKL